MLIFDEAASVLQPKRNGTGLAYKSHRVEFSLPPSPWLARPVTMRVSDCSAVFLPRLIDFLATTTTATASAADDVVVVGCKHEKANKTSKNWRREEEEESETTLEASEREHQKQFCKSKSSKSCGHV